MKGKVIAMLVVSLAMGGGGPLVGRQLAQTPAGAG